VKQIVEAHGGEVKAESVHGAGATFTFTLPAEEQAETKESSSD
jgi:signal transduction histidine kinase